jgi:hypothetical protein
MLRTAVLTCNNAENSTSETLLLTTVECAIESGLGKRGAANQRTYSGDDASNYNAPPQRTVTHFLALDKVLPGRYVL